MSSEERVVRFENEENEGADDITGSIEATRNQGGRVHLDECIDYEKHYGLLTDASSAR